MEDRSNQTFNAYKHTASFRGPLNCKRVKVNLYDPFSRVDEGMNVPGVGSYDLEKNSIHQKSMDKLSYGQGSSSMFQVHHRDRVANVSPEKKVDTPGPGHY